MKYYNKTRTIEQKVLDRETLDLMREQNHLLNDILKHFKNNYKIMRIYTLPFLIVLSLFFSCGSLKIKEEKNVEMRGDLPPNVSSNKYSKKRNF